MSWRKTPFRLCCLSILLTLVNLRCSIFLWSWWRLRLFSLHYHYPSSPAEGRHLPCGGQRRWAFSRPKAFWHVAQHLAAAAKGRAELLATCAVAGNVTKLRAGERSWEVSTEVLLRTNHLRRARVAFWLLKQFAQTSLCSDPQIREKTAKQGQLWKWQK